MKKTVDNEMYIFSREVPMLAGISSGLGQPSAFS